MSYERRLTAAANLVQPKSVPRTVTSHVIKQIKAASKAYEALGEAYVQLSNMPKLKAQIKSGSEIWAEVRLRISYQD